MTQTCEKHYTCRRQVFLRGEILYRKKEEIISSAHYASVQRSFASAVIGMQFLVHAYFHTHNRLLCMGIFNDYYITFKKKNWTRGEDPRHARRRIFG